MLILSFEALFLFGVIVVLFAALIAKTESRKVLGGINKEIKGLKVEILDAINNKEANGVDQS